MGVHLDSLCSHLCWGGLNPCVLQQSLCHCPLYMMYHATSQNLLGMFVQFVGMFLCRHSGSGFALNLGWCREVLFVSSHSSLI